MSKWLSIVALTGCLSAQAETVYPAVTLKNEQLEVSVYLPDAERGYYRGTRFDWSGIIGQVEHAGHTFHAPLHPVHDPHLHDSISGPAEEFGMVAPMGFAEAAPGESFVKIGVGILRKGSGEEYAFNGVYELIQPGTWEVEHGPDWIRFEQKLTGERGFGYRYEKSIRLVPKRAELVIEHILENTGRRKIDLDHYNHNFTLIDAVPYGPDYSVEFPFSASEPKSIGGFAHYRGNTLIADEVLGDRSLWIPVFEGEGSVADNAATVRNRKTGASLSFRGDTAITRMVFWAVEAAACPEPFIAIDLNPGQIKRWSSHYTYRANR